MKINFKHLILLMAIGLIGGQSCFACISANSEPGNPIIAWFIFMGGAIIFFSPAYFYHLYIKNGGTKKWLIKLWGCSAFLVFLAFVIRGIISLTVGCTG